MIDSMAFFLLLVSRVQETGYIFTILYINLMRLFCKIYIVVRGRPFVFRLQNAPPVRRRSAVAICVLRAFVIYCTATEIYKSAYISHIRAAGAVGKWALLAINKVMRAAIKEITALELDIKKNYKLQRQFELLTARLRGAPGDYQMWERVIEANDHAIPVRLFAPEGKGPFPLMLFFHGGGWVTGGIENYTGVCADLAKATGTTVASVDYRLAPEHKFPAAVEDCYTVARELFLGKFPDVNTGNITLAGDSAGGNLAAVVSLMARDRGEFLPQRQILIYPSTYNNHSDASPFESIRDNGTDYILTSRRMNDVIELYRGSEEDLSNPYFAPLLAEDFSNQPQTLVITAQYCPLRDEGEAYGRKLREAGNDVTVVCIEDALHAFLMLPPGFEHVQMTYRHINNFLAQR